MNYRVIIPIVLTFIFISFSINISFSENTVGGSASLVYKRGDKNAIITPEVYFNGYIKYQPYLVLVIPCKLDNNKTIKSIEKFNGEISYYDKNGNRIEYHIISSSTDVRIDNGEITDQLVNWLHLAPDKPVYVKKAFDMNNKYFNGTKWLWSNTSYLAVTLNLSNSMFQHILNNSKISKIVINFSTPNDVEVKDENDNTKYCKPVSITLYVIDAPLNSIYQQSLTGEDKGSHIELVGVVPRIKLVEIDPSKIKKLLVLNVIYKANISVYNITKTGANLEENNITFVQHSYATIGFSVLKFGSKVYLAYAPMINSYTANEKTLTIDAIKNALEANYTYYVFSNISLMKGNESLSGLKSLTVFVKCSDNSLSGIYTLNKEDLEHFNEYVCNASNKEDIFPSTEMYSITYIIPFGKDDETKNVKYLYNKILVVNASKFNIDFSNKNIYKIVLLGYTIKPENPRIKIEKPFYSLVDLLDDENVIDGKIVTNLDSDGLVKYFTLLDTFDPSGNFSAEVKKLIADFRDRFGVYVYGKVIDVSPNIEQYGNIVIIKLRFNISSFGPVPLILHILFTVLDNSNQQAVEDSIKFTATNFALDVYYNANTIIEEGSPEIVPGYKVTFQPYPSSPFGEKMYVLSFIPTITIQQQSLPSLPPIFPIYKIAEKGFYYGYKLWWSTHIFLTKSLHGFKLAIAPFVFYKPLVRHVAVAQMHATAETYLSKIVSRDEAKAFTELLGKFEDWEAVSGITGKNDFINFMLEYGMEVDPYSLDYYIIGIQRVGKKTIMWLNPDSAFGQLASYYDIAKEGVSVTFDKFKEIVDELHNLWNVQIDESGTTFGSLFSSKCSNILECSAKDIIDIIEKNKNKFISLEDNHIVKRKLYDLEFLVKDKNGKYTYNKKNILKRLIVDKDTNIKNLIPDADSISMKELLKKLAGYKEAFKEGFPNSIKIKFKVAGEIIDDNLKLGKQIKKIFQVRKYTLQHWLVGDILDQQAYDALLNMYYVNNPGLEQRFSSVKKFRDTIHNKLQHIRDQIKTLTNLEVKDLFKTIVEDYVDNGKTFTRKELLEEIIKKYLEKNGKVGNTLHDILYGYKDPETDERVKGLYDKIKDLKLKIEKLQVCKVNPVTCDSVKEKQLLKEIGELKKEIQNDLDKLHNVFSRIKQKANSLPNTDKMKNVKEILNKIDERICDLKSSIFKSDKLEVLLQDTNRIVREVETIERAVRTPVMYYYSKYAMGLRALSNKLHFATQLINLEKLAKKIEEIGSKLEKAKLWFKNKVLFRSSKVRNFAAKISEIANTEMKFPLINKYIKLGRVVGTLGTVALGGVATFFEAELTRTRIDRFSFLASTLRQSSYKEGASIAIPIIIGFYSQSSVGVPIFIEFNEIPTIKFPKQNIVDLVFWRVSIGCGSDFPAKTIYIYSHTLNDYPINQYNPPMTLIFDFYTGENESDFDNWWKRFYATMPALLTGADTAISVCLAAAPETAGLSLLVAGAIALGYMYFGHKAACESIMHIPLHERVELLGYKTFGLPFKRISAKLSVDAELMGRTPEEIKGVPIDISNDLQLSILLNASAVKKMFKDVCNYVYFGKYNEGDGNCYAGQLFNGTEFEFYAKALEPYYGPINLSVLLDTGYIYGGILYLPSERFNFTPSKYINFLNSIYGYIKSNYICSDFYNWYKTKVWNYTNSSLSLAAAALYIAMKDTSKVANLGINPKEFQARLMTSICMEAITFIGPENPSPTGNPDIIEICQQYISLCQPSLEDTFQELLNMRYRGYSATISATKLPSIITTEDIKMEFLTDHIWVGTYNDSGKLKYLIKAPLVFHIAKLDENYLIDTIKFKIVNHGCWMDICRVEKEVKIPIYGMQIRFGIDVVGYDPLNNTYYSMVAKNLPFISDSNLITVPINGKDYYFIKADIVNLSDLSILPQSRMTLIYNASPTDPTPNLMVYVYNNTKDKTVNYIRIFYSEEYDYDKFKDNALLDYDNYSKQFVPRPNFIKVINDKTLINRIYNFIKNGISDINSIGYTKELDEDDPWIYAKDVANILKQLFNNKGYLDVFYLFYRETDKGLTSNVIAVPNESEGVIDIFATKGFIGYNDKEYLKRYEYMKPTDEKAAAFYWLYPKVENCATIWCRVLHVERAVDWANIGYVFQGYFEVSMKVDKELIDNLIMKCSRKYKHCKILIVAKPEKSRFIPAEAARTSPWNWIIDIINAD